MNTATLVQIVDKTVCISHYTNIFGNSMNATILPPGMGCFVLLRINSFRVIYLPSRLGGGGGCISAES